MENSRGGSEPLVTVMLITVLPLTEQKLGFGPESESFCISFCGSAGYQQEITANVHICGGLVTAACLPHSVLSVRIACWALWLIFLANLMKPSVRSASLRIVHCKPLSLQMILSLFSNSDV